MSREEQYEELRELVRKAISIVEAFDSNCDWLNEAKETLDDHRAMAASEKQELGRRGNSLWMWAG
jgi:FtsZ-binding cell division protein ZapB